MPRHTLDFLPPGATPVCRYKGQMGHEEQTLMEITEKHQVSASLTPTSDGGIQPQTEIPSKILNQDDFGLSQWWLNPQSRTILIWTFWRRNSVYLPVSDPDYFRESFQRSLPLDMAISPHAQTHTHTRTQAHTPMVQLAFSVSREASETEKITPAT